MREIRSVRIPPDVVRSLYVAEVFLNASKVTRGGGEERTERK